ncbi:MAG TPA: MGMT family protein [Sporichthyaceae bacterium]|nr:MGMT family protein [Sporichthyaceae bacterium]
MTARRGLSPSGGRHSEDYAEGVLAVVEAIPAGRVMSYGDIAEFLGVGGPRQVGSVLSRRGAAVPWWRVVHADGTAPPGKDGRARREWVAERTPLRPGGRVDMAHARWVPRPPGSDELRHQPGGANLSVPSDRMSSQC